MLGLGCLLIAVGVMPNRSHGRRLKIKPTRFFLKRR